MVDSGTEKDQSAMRQHLLEVEVARLNTEIAVLKGEAEPAEAAARLLAMAASTVDQAMADARREADELLVAMAADAGLAAMRRIGLPDTSRRRPKRGESRPTINRLLPKLPASRTGHRFCC